MHLLRIHWSSRLVQTVSKTTSISLHVTCRPTRWGQVLITKAGFVSLAEIDVTDAQKAQDAMCVIDRALEEVSSTRGEIGAFQKNNLESNLNYLRIARECDEF